MKTERTSLIKITKNVYRRPDSPNLYVYASFKRLKIPRLLKSLRTTQIGIAKTLALDEIYKHQEQYRKLTETSPSKESKLIREVIDEIKLFQMPKKRIRTQENYEMYLSELASELGNEPITEFTLEKWSYWLRDFSARKSRRTFSDYAKYMNLILRFAHGRRYVSHLIKVENPDPKHETHFRVYSEREIQSLWHVMNEETRDQFVLSYECFMRLREVLYLSWDRVNLDEGEITLRPIDVKTGSKTGKGRTFKVSENALIRLKRRFKERESETWVFPNRYGIAPVDQNKTAWINSKRKAGIVGRARWHDLRHTAISHALLDQHVDPVLVSEYAGVSLKTLLKVYLHSTAKQTAVVSTALSVYGKRVTNIKRKE